MRKKASLGSNSAIRLQKIQQLDQLGSSTFPDVAECATVYLQKLIVQLPINGTTAIAIHQCDLAAIRPEGLRIDIHRLRWLQPPQAMQNRFHFLRIGEIFLPHTSLIGSHGLDSNHYTLLHILRRLAAPSMQKLRQHNHERNQHVFDIAHLLYSLEWAKKRRICDIFKRNVIAATFGAIPLSRLIGAISAS